MEVALGSYALGWAAGVPGWPLPEGSWPGRPGVPLPLDVAGLVEVARQLGFRRVQWADNLPPERMAPARWSALLEWCRSRGWVLEAGARGLTPEALTRQISLAAEAGSPVLRMVIDAADHAPALDAVVAWVAAAVPLLAEHRVVLAIENHDRFSAAALRDAMEDLDSPWVGICLDTANSLGAGEGLETVVNALGPWVVNLHLKDVAIRRLPHQFGFTVEGVPLGTGLLTAPVVRDVVARCPRARSVVLEQWVPPAGSVGETVAREAEWARAGASTLRRWWPEALEPEAAA